jgi:hypothetical protein
LLNASSGATAIGSRYVLGRIPVFVEFITKVLGDLGVLGLAAYAWLFWALLRTSLGAVGRARAQQDLGGLALAGAMFTIQMLVSYSGYDLAVAAVLFWFLSGLLTATPPSGAAVAPQTEGAHPTPRGRWVQDQST